MTLQTIEDELFSLFLTREVSGRIAAKKHNTRFVHYTSAEAAMSIIKNSEMWMRNGLFMNDFMEIRHGSECVGQFLKSDVGSQFFSTMDGVFEGFSSDLMERFNRWLPSFQRNTYLLSVSEHLNREDRIGRLSMWRAYGGACGVALVMNNTPLMASTDALNVYSSPVFYSDVGNFVFEMRSVVARIKKSMQLLAGADYEVVMHFAFMLLRLGVLCTKHPGFGEELEWRIYYDPRFEKSSFVAQDVEAINGTPQLVQKIPLQNAPDKGLYDADIPGLIDKVIVGPTQYPRAVYEAFVELLRQRGVTDAQDRVIVSDIPLRQ